MRKAERGTIMQAFRVFVVATLFVTMAGYVLYLLSDKHSHLYRLAQNEALLTVERGRFLPLGFEAYVPSEPMLQQAYAPIAIPMGELVDTAAIFPGALTLRSSPSWTRTPLPFCTCR